ncbi:hypothetical protein [Bacillus sp. FSL R5-0447]|uniref:hypothetical protein n=1 Tax=Bacillus sp. FSL R5-0447 TaxID=2975303 RepID=UPI00315B395E
MNQSYKFSLEKLPIESLENLKTDIQNRINDGLRTDNNVYIKDQRRKLRWLDEVHLFTKGGEYNASSTLRIWKRSVKKRGLIPS